MVDRSVCLQRWRNTRNTKDGMAGMAIPRMGSGGTAGDQKKNYNKAKGTLLIFDWCLVFTCRIYGGFCKC